MDNCVFLKKQQKKIEVSNILIFFRDLIDIQNWIGTNVAEYESNSKDLNLISNLEQVDCVTTTCSLVKTQNS